MRTGIKLSFLSVLIALSVLFTSTCVSGANELHWYIKKTANHIQPPLPSEFAFIKENGGIWLDENCENKLIYLTFDAGYENGNIASVLDTLKKHSAHGTFFILKNMLENETELVKRMFNEGHTVANHTMNHKNMASVTDTEALTKEITALESLCLEKTGNSLAKLYRPPEGSFSDEHLKAVNALGYKTVFWSFAYADWDNSRQPDCEKALSNLIEHTHSGEVLLLHPTSSTNARILDSYLTWLEENGYGYGCLEKL